MHVPIEQITTHAFTVPTDAPESDGTLQWDETTIVVVQAEAEGEVGLGYSYVHGAAAHLIDGKLAPLITGHNAFAVPDAYHAMIRSVRNLSRSGFCSCAISAVDTALWDLKARLLGLPLADLFGRIRKAVPVYGSGGFTSYDEEQLREQLGGWAAQGIEAVKMKVGRHPQDDLARVATAREAIGEETDLFVDANGAYSRKQALRFAEAFAEVGVSWFEEPVSSDDLAGLRLLRDRGPAGLEIAAGEYGTDPFYFRRMLEAEAVDVLQADATRCGGFTGFAEVSVLCRSRPLDLSAHTAPNLHVHLACSLPRFRHIEYFHDHVRIERMLFEGALSAEGGMLAPDLSRNGNGLTLDLEAADEYRVFP